MIYRALADLVLIAHFAFVLFVMLGGLLVLHRRRLVWLHVPAFLWGVLVQLANWTCPLTPLENWCRRMGGEAGYTGGFVEYYLSAVLYPEQVTYTMRFALGLLLMLLNVIVYSYVLLRWHQSTKRSKEPEHTGQPTVN
jgi:hypothetical protein